MRRIVTALVLAAAACSSNEEPASQTPRPTESSLRAPLPLPRTEVAGATWQGMVAAVGGLTADGAVSDRVDLYDPATDSWRRGPALPTPLHHVGLAARGDRLYVAGGYANGPGGGWEPQARVVSLGPGEGTWREEAPLGVARGALALAATNERLVAIGGVSTAGVTATTEVLVPGAPAWRRGPDLVQAREHLGGAASAGRVHAIGGRVGSLETNLASVESWDPAAAEGWREEPSLNDRRGGTSAASADGLLCVAGGEAPSGTIASVECLREGRWQRAGRLSAPRHGLAVAGPEGKLHVVGGGPTPGLSVSGAHEVFLLPR